MFYAVLGLGLIVLIQLCFNVFIQAFSGPNNISQNQTYDYGDDGRYYEVNCSFGAYRLAVPSIRETNTKGTTIMVIMRRKTVPMGSIRRTFSPKINPAIIPNTNPRKIFV